MKKTDITELFSSFNGMKALVIGDVMIDAYYEGKVDRISPEAPVPVVHVTKSEKRLGGAANVAQNLRALGATPILCSVIGEDFSGLELKKLMENDGLPTLGILSSSDRVTTVKTRIISGSQQMIRVDEEQIESLSYETLTAFEKTIKNLLDKNSIDVIIFEDYDKGVISETLITSVVSMAHLNDIPVTVDPKKENFLAYRNVDLFKPNLKELREGLKLDLNEPSIDKLVNADLKLREILNHKNSLITLSEYGVYYGGENGSDILPAHLRKIADVSGAGDTVIAVASLCLAAKLSNHWLAQISNLAGGLVCEKVGVVPIDKQSLMEESLNLCKE